MRNNNDKKDVVSFMKYLIRDMRNNYDNVGIIFDKDGTIILNSELNEALKKLKKNFNIKIWTIANSGRTIRGHDILLKQGKYTIRLF